MDGNMSLEKFLADVRSKTGVAIYASPQGGEETAFTAEWKGSRLRLYIGGTGEEAEREANLVRYFLASSLPAGGRREQLKAVLLGEGGELAAFRFLTKYNLTDGPCFAADILPDKRIGDALEHVERCLDEGDLAVRMDDSRVAVVKFLADGQSSFEFALFLNQSLYEEAGIRARIGVGCEMKSFGEAAVSYAQAVSATRLSGMFYDKGEVHAYREYLLVRMLSDLSKERLKEYLAQFRIVGAEEILSDEELSGTAEMFLESDLNLSETSRALFVHRNTLSYRLDKIERITGLDIRKFPDAVTFRVVTILIKLLQA